MIESNIEAYDVTIKTYITNNYYDKTYINNLIS